MSVVVVASAVRESGTQCNTNPMRRGVVWSGLTYLAC